MNNEEYIKILDKDIKVADLTDQQQLLVNLYQKMTNDQNNLAKKFDSLKVEYENVEYEITKLIAARRYIAFQLERQISGEELNNE